MDHYKELLFKTDDFFKSIGLDYFVTGSTLLRVVRDNGVKIEKETDREINLSCLYNDLTEERIKKIKEMFPYFLNIDGKIKPHTAMWFSDKEFYDDKNNVKWKGDNFILLSTYLKGKDNNMYMDVGYEHGLYQPKELIGDKSKWGYVYILGRKFNTPADSIKYFENYYGKDWLIPNKDWSWLANAKNFINITNLKEQLC